MLHIPHHLCPCPKQTPPPTIKFSPGYLSTGGCNLPSCGYCGYGSQGDQIFEVRTVILLYVKTVILRMVPGDIQDRENLAVVSLGWVKIRQY